MVTRFKGLFRYGFLFIFGFAIFMQAACKKEDDTDTRHITTPYNLQPPEYFPILTLNDANPTTEEGVALGRKLYYDPILHPDGTRACASCHNQTNSFSTGALVGNRSVMAHINLGWSRNFLWEGNVQGQLEDITRFEVEGFFGTDVEKLKAHATYPGDFEKAFGTREITTELCAKALAQFLRTMISADSKFDRYLRKEVELTPSEYRGYEIFNTEKGDCFHCHALPLMTDGLFHNNGLNTSFSDQDEGLFKVTGNQHDLGKFKTPTLRNIELTAPYMHDGRFTTLSEVIDFYSEDLRYSPTVDPLMKNVNRGGIRLSPAEKQDLLNFLMTLLDSSYINNPNFGSPF